MSIGPGKVKRLLRISLGVLAAGFVFVTGMVWGRLGWPPYELIRDIGLTAWRGVAHPDPPPGRFREVQDRPGSRRSLTEEQRTRISELESLGYLSGTVAASGNAGVTIHQREFAFNGLNLATDGHKPEAILMNMNGRILHRWHYPFERAYPEASDTSGAPGRQYWRRVALLEGGDLLGIYEGQGLVRLDRNSRLVWAYQGRAHHDLDVLPDGTVYVLTREAEILPSINPHEPVLHDHVTVVNADGTERKRVSIVQALQESPYSILLARAGDSGDFLHTNSVKVLEGRLADRIPAFAAGNVLISIPMIDAIAVLDMDEERIVWAMAGLWEFQHDPLVLDNGHLLVFDNKGDGGASRVLEIDPVTQAIPWLYSGKTHGFYSETCGANQRLPNGNTLITESDNGRAFEVTSQGKVVWEYHTPHRAGEQGELVATLFEVVRITDEPSYDWLSSSSGPNENSVD